MIDRGRRGRNSVDCVDDSSLLLVYIFNRVCFKMTGSFSSKMSIFKNVWSRDVPIEKELKRGRSRLLRAEARLWLTLKFQP